MDIRKLFVAISNELSAKFEKTVQIKHNGGKGDNRENAFVEFLNDYLPSKYGVGRGEVISPENEISGEMDILIFDKAQCPLFLKSESHSLYPRESIFGAISMKSHLGSEELKDAYKNIASLKKTMFSQNFQKSSASGFSTGFNPVVPVTAIFAYAANRSLKAISNQVKILDEELTDINLRPDFIVILGLGIIGQKGRIRGDFNKYNLSQDRDELSLLRETGRHTLLRFYIQFLDELNSITQPELNLNLYFDMPVVLGTHKVKGHNRLISYIDDTDNKIVKSLALSAIEKIIKDSKIVTLEQHYINYLGTIPLGVEKLQDLSSCIYEYNPRNKPKLQIVYDADGIPFSDDNTFRPIYIRIDGNNYAVDLASLNSDDFEDNPDFTVDELMSQ